MTENIISSTQNAKLKQLLLLQQKSSFRRETGLFVVEGRRELMHCINAGYDVKTIFLCPEICVPDPQQPRLPEAIPTFLLTKNAYEKAAYRGGTEGIMAEVKAKDHSLSRLKLSEKPLVIVTEGVEKPGNLGAIMRTADAAKADAVIICDPLTDLYNPNLIRSSVGAVFTVQCSCCTTAQCIAFLKGKNIQIITAQLQDSEPYYSVNMRLPTALVMGNEAAGLTQEWRDNADKHVRIPMSGKIDSLNVSVSTAILAFEAVRQRTSLP